MKFERFVIQDEQGRFFWGMTRRSGYGFEDEEMPKFWEMNDRTVLFDSEMEAKAYMTKRDRDFRGQGLFSIVPVNVSITLKKKKRNVVKKTRNHTLW